MGQPTLFPDRVPPPISDWLDGLKSQQPKPTSPFADVDIYSNYPTTTFTCLRGQEKYPHTKTTDRDEIPASQPHTITTPTQDKILTRDGPTSNLK